MLNKTGLISVAGITAFTILGLTALIVNSKGRFDSNWSKEGGSLTIQGELSISE